MKKTLSQTSMDERLGLYNLTSTNYNGDGYIYDIGSAAGGSTLCMALGLEENPLDESSKHKKIYSFDLFSGYSMHAFSKNPIFSDLKRKKDWNIETDIDLFNAITDGYERYILPVPIDLEDDFDKYKAPSRIEVAHIDAGKSLPLWNSIINVIADGVMPGKTTFIFQDFERCRLPWQWMFIAELMQEGIANWVGQYDGGTIHLRIDKPIPHLIVENSTRFSYSESRALKLWSYIDDYIRLDSKRLSVFNGDFDNISMCTLAYIYYYLDNSRKMRDAYNRVEKTFLEADPVYNSELIKLMGSMR